MSEHAPTAAREHELSEGCWCGPRVDHRWHGRVIAHNFAPAPSDGQGAASGAVKSC